jgi:predicted AAA+ superfamily ATPase
MTYIPRDILKALLRAARIMPVVVITGMRQTGKSTFLQNQPELKQYRYITLDSFAQLAAAKENPLSFIDTGEKLIIDEAQRCPELFIAVKQISEINSGQSR